MSSDFNIDRGFWEESKGKVHILCSLNSDEKADVRIMDVRSFKFEKFLCLIAISYPKKCPPIRRVLCFSF